MTIIFRETVTFFVYGIFIAMEFILVFGMLIAALAVPYAIAIYKLGAMPGSTGTAWALFIGVLLMGAWSAFLMLGGRRKISNLFRIIIQWSLRGLGINENQGM